MRLSELIGLDRSSIMLGTGAHVRCMGKGRKERCTPLTRFVWSAVQAWLKEPAIGDSEVLFSTRQGRRLSADTVQYFVAKYAAIARECCPSLQRKRITPHALRHSAAM